MPVARSLSPWPSWPDAKRMSYRPDAVHDHRMITGLVGDPIRDGKCDSRV
jgi:hypothetical protein